MMDMRNTKSNFRSSNSLPKPAKEVIHIQDIVNGCLKCSVKCESLAHTELESAMGIISLRACRDKNQNCKSLYIFVTAIRAEKMQVAIFYDGSEIESRSVGSQNQIPDIINTNLDSIHHKPEAINSKHYANKDNGEKMSKLCGILIDKSHKLSSKSQFQAAQDLKLSSEYMNIIAFLKELIMDMQQLCIETESMKSYIRKRHENILKMAFELETQKTELDNRIFEYDQARQESANIRARLDDFIRNQREIVEKKDFYDEESFERYFQELKKLKLLENHRKYLN